MSNSVTGSDGMIPIQEPDIPHRLWFMGDIWLGDDAAGKYVARVDDLVYEVSGGSVVIYRVVSVNDEDLTPVFKEVIVKVESSTLTEADVLFGLVGNSQADTYRVYVDKSTNPYTMCVDQRLQVNGTMTKYAKIFKGAILTDKGTVVSKVYDNSGNYISENIPLEVVAINSHDNYAIKSIPPCKTTHDLVDGEIVTVVLYSDNGGVVSKKQLLVENTGFIRDSNANTRYVSHISLETVFLKQGDGHVIQYPVNLPLNNINLMGVVHYSDGSTMRLPIDGRKFKLAGLNEFVSTIVGQKAELVLIYMLGANEVAFGTTTTDEKAITEPYELEVVDQDIDLSVKLYAYPEWLNENDGYRLNFYLYTQDRSLWYKVTDLVQFDNRTDAIDGTAYGYRQQKTVYINMKDVSPTYKSYIHVQNIDLVLLRRPYNREPTWRIKSVANENYQYFGDGLFAITLGDENGQYIDLSNGIESVEEWLKVIYEANQPMYDSVYEKSYPMPTHFYLTVGTETRKYIVDRDWNTYLPIENKPTLYKNAGIRFTREIGGNVLHLMYVELPIVE